MRTLIVGINYNTDGTRYINQLLYKTFHDMIQIRDITDNWKRTNDEVYIIDLNPSHTDFIQEIVLNGCRM